MRRNGPGKADGRAPRRADRPTLDGPWTQEAQPITPPGYGHSMLFKRFDGQWVMSVHHHSQDERGRTVRVPHLFEVDLSGDKLVVGKQIYNE